MMHSRKGQVYVFVAILLIAFAFSVTRPHSASESKKDAFTELYENFERESPVVVNSALRENLNVSAEFAAFAVNYFDYARTKSPKFRFLYILRDNDALLVGNRLGLSVNASFSGASYNVSDGAILTATPGDLTIDVEGLDYSFSIGPEPYQVRSIFRQQVGRERRVYVSG